MEEKIFIYDTTLRDGSQGENISFTVEEKIKVAQRLDSIGIHYIEGGWPGSNPRDMLFFEKAKEIPLKNAKLAAFGATRKPNITAEADENLNALIESQTPVVTIFGKSWDLHVEKVMKNTLSENLHMIYESIAFLKERDREVIYDAEHFFDGYKNNPDYAILTLKEAVAAKADAIVLCDTNGGTLPHELIAILDDVKKKLKNRSTGEDEGLPILGIHAHNDSGVAVANSIEAVHNGIRMVQGTVNGYGERCGNADIVSIIPILTLKMGYATIGLDSIKALRKTSRFISETANMIPQSNRPFVGKSAFAHKGGVHVSAVMKEARAYEHVDPGAVGNKRRVLMSDLSGKSNVEYKAKELGIELGDSEVSKKIVREIKRLEQEGYQFDVADGSFKILLEKFADQFTPLFEFESFRVYIEKEKGLPCTSHAVLSISVNGEEKITVDKGHGPVNALDNALRKALDKYYPNYFDTTHLVDFKVRVMDGRAATSSKVRVLIESRDEDKIWSTIGVSEDIIEASWQALTDSFQYKFSKEDENGA